jgi:hypothetical protein
MMYNLEVTRNQTFTVGDGQQASSTR